MKQRRRIRLAAKIVIAIALVVTGIIIFAGRMRMRKPVETQDFGTPRLPVMYININDTVVNTMYGYTVEQDEKSERDSLTLLSADRTLNLKINPNGNRLESISYEITSLSDDSFVENGNATGLEKQDDDSYSAEVAVTTPILMNQEYAIKFNLTIQKSGGDKEDVYFYTRLVQQTGTNISDYLSFAEDFYKSCLDKENTDQIASHMESDASGSGNNGFGYVTINSSIDQVTWGNLKPALYREGIPKIKEINQETASIELDYIITSEDDDGNTEYYDVHDFYRLRSNQGEILLVDLERKTNQVFDPELSIFEDNRTNLGIREGDVSYLLSPGGKKVAFVSGGEIWMLGSEDGDSATQVFSFRGTGEPTSQTENTMHRFQICNLTDDGDLTFVLYGYMSAGVHEGTTGIGVYHYTASENVLEESLFIASDLSYEMLNNSLSKLSYSNEKNQLYLFTGSQLLRIDVTNGKSEVISNKMKSNCLAASRDQRYAAWMTEMDPDASTTVRLMDTESGEATDISAGSGEKIRVLGFFEDDLVYGLARDEDVVTDATGNTTFGMYKLCIVGSDGTIRKEYQQDGHYVSGTSWTDSGNLELELSVKTDQGTFRVDGSDHIIDTGQSGDSVLEFTTDSDSRAGYQLYMPFAAGKNISKNVRVSGLKDNTGVLSITLPKGSGEKTDNYYVYAGGSLADILEDSNEALRLADDARGVVLNEKQQYVYQRGNWGESAIIDPATLPEQLLQAPLDASEVQNIVGGDYTVLNFSGCSTYSLRYQLSRGYPVVAKLSDDKNVLIVQYDIFENLWYYDPETKETKAIGKNDSAEQFAAQGNLFLSYYKTEETDSSAD